MPNVGFLLSGMEKQYSDDIRGVVEAAGNVPVKIMLELPLLNEAQRRRAVEISIEAGVAYLKNASGGAVWAWPRPKICVFLGGSRHLMFA